MGSPPAAVETGLSAATGVILPTIVGVVVGSPPAAVETGLSAATGVILPTTGLFAWGFNLRAARPKPTGQLSRTSGHLPDFLALRALFFGPPLWPPPLPEPLPPFPPPPFSASCWHARCVFRQMAHWRARRCGQLSSHPPGDAFHFAADLHSLGVVGFPVRRYVRFLLPLLCLLPGVHPTTRRGSNSSVGTLRCIPAATAQREL